MGSALSIVPCHCACLTYFLHPKLRNINVVLITLTLIQLTLRRAVHTPYGCQPADLHAVLHYIGDDFTSARGTPTRIRTSGRTKGSEYRGNYSQTALQAT